MGPRFSVFFGVFGIWGYPHEGQLFPWCPPLAQSNGGDDAPPALPDWATKIPEVDYSVAFMDLHEPEKEVSESESKFRPHDGLTDG